MNMRCKLYIESIKQYGQNKQVTQEELQLRAITSGKKNADDVDEDNTFSKYTPSADFRMTVTNPALLETFKPGTVFYVDMTEVE